MRVRIDHNQSIIKIMNNTDETIYYSPQLSMGIVDIRSLGYYNVSKRILLFDKRGNNRIPPPTYRVPKLHPHQYYKTGNSGEIPCQSRKDQSDLEIEKDPYPWLDFDDPRRDITDEQILEKFIDLSDSDLSSPEKDTLLKLVKQYKEDFSLRDEIDKFPNIKIDIDVVDDSPFLLDLFLYMKRINPSWTDIWLS